MVKTIWRLRGYGNMLIFSKKILITSIKSRTRAEFFKYITAGDIIVITHNLDFTVEVYRKFAYPAKYNFECKPKNIQRKDVSTVEVSRLLENFNWLEV